MDILSPYQDLVFIVINDQISHGVGAIAGNLIVAGGGAGVTDGGTDPGQQLVRAEGFGQIVVSPQVQGVHLVSLMRPGGDHHHRQTGPAPKLSQNVQTVHVRQTQVQNDQVRAMGGDHGQCFRPGTGLHGFIAVGVQYGGDEVRNALLIFNHQNFFTDIHRIPP